MTSRSLTLAAYPNYMTEYRNKIINGNFDIWQRGTGAFTGVGVYTADRWVMSNGTGATNSITRGGPITPSTSTLCTYCVTWNRSVAGSATSTFIQAIENARTSSGKRVTVTFYANSVANTTLDVFMYQNFGTGGSPSANVSTPTTTVNLTPTWTRFDVLVDVPSVSSKVFGTTDNSFLALAFGRQSTDVNPTTGVNISHVSVVEGDVRTEDDPFSARHYQHELNLCMRYYQVQDIPPYYISGLPSTSQLYAPFLRPVPMRTTPSMVVASTPNGYSTGGGAITLAAFSFAYITAAGFTINATYGSTFGGWSTGGLVTSNAEF